MNYKDIVNAVTNNLEINLYPTQEKIAELIINPNKEKIHICCYTRYGKTYSVAFGICLYILLNDDKRIKVIAPKTGQANILRDYIIDFLIEHESFRNLLPLETDKTERLQKQMSKKKIDFTNKCSLEILTAGGDLMGYGSDLLVIDEACKIEDEKYNKEINRMIEGKVVEVGNPLHRQNFFWRHFNNDKYLNIHIGEKQGIKEGRHSKEYFDEKALELGGKNTREYQILYKSRFPDSSEASLIRWSWIEKAVEKETNIKGKTIYGLDVAAAGNDLNVLTKIKTNKQTYKIENINNWSCNDTMETVARVTEKIDKQNQVNIDSIGIGKGVADRLKEKGYNINLINVGEKSKDKTMLNKKAEYYWYLRTLFEEQRINIPNHSKLKNQLTALKIEYTSKNKKKIKDPSKSPDYADSLMLACSKEKQEELMISKYDPFEK